MSGLPGERVYRIAARFLSAHTIDSVIAPAVADLQHEVRSATSTWRRVRARARGYTALARAVALVGATAPARVLRDDWSASHARGPRLLAALVPHALWLGVLVTSAMTALVARAPGLQFSGDPAIVVISLPASVSATLPLVFVLALVMALGRLGGGTSSGPRSWLGAAVVLSLVPAVVVFVLAAWITPVANQAWLERIFRKVIAEEARTGEHGIVPGEPVRLSKGTRELTLGELEDHIASARVAGQDPVKWVVEWHKKWALGAASLALAPLAVGLHGFFRRRRTTWAFLSALAVGVLQLAVLQPAEIAAVRGALPAWAAMWAGDVLVVLLALALLVVTPPDRAVA